MNNARIRITELTGLVASSKPENPWVLQKFKAVDLETDNSALSVTISYGQGDVWTSPEVATYSIPKDEWSVYWTIPGDAALGLYDVKVEVTDGDGGSFTLEDTGEFDVTA